ncbi:histidine phosphatase family protein [Mesobaculum littorinae]|uniref:Histidine phosphatase family protein n=1 Tax=Mesobaculum littorinae TaxID=2486419 RepID=A0A438AEJ3_9RHOB|nr:histidine phosphatase family protein [Mesobaculum littorinae]RVV97104.1 histidine phosphatase family protein [Mesobaculum littorinae]
MALRLILVRHAKSSWDNPTVDDHDRSLNGRGREAAPRMGAWMAERGHVPDCAAVSTARRAVETWEGLCSAWPTVPQTAFKSSLYHAGPDRMLSVLRLARGTRLLMVGHNPGIGAFATQILRHRPTHEAFTRFPTTAVLVADFDIDSWEDAAFAGAETVDFAVPRDLP